MKAIMNLRNVIAAVIGLIMLSGSIVPVWAAGKTSDGTETAAPAERAEFTEMKEGPLPGTIHYGYADDPAHLGGSRFFLDTKDHIAYCYNFYNFYPHQESYPGTPAQYMKQENASADQFYESTYGYTDQKLQRMDYTSPYPKEQAELLKRDVLQVIYNGYPNDSAGIQAALEISDNDFRIATQHAVWARANQVPMDLAASDVDEEGRLTQIQKAYELLAGRIDKITLKDGRTFALQDVPEGYELDIYKAVNQHQGKIWYQNLLSGRFVYTSIHAVKRWSGSVPARPSTKEFAAWVRLYQNGADVSTRYRPSVTENADGTYSIEYTHLPKRSASGTEYRYTIGEDENARMKAGYSLTVMDAAGHILAAEVVENGGLLINAKQTVSIAVEKKWAGGASGDDADIILTINGKKAGVRLTLSESNHWKGTFQDLPQYDDSGAAIVYGVMEETRDFSYTVESDGRGGYIVTNYPKESPTEESAETPDTPEDENSETPENEDPEIPDIRSDSQGADTVQNQDSETDVRLEDQASEMSDAKIRDIKKPAGDALHAAAARTLGGKKTVSPPKTGDSAGIIFGTALAVGLTALLAAVVCRRKREFPI